MNNYLDWVMKQESDEYELIRTDEDTIYIKSPTVKGEIAVYHLELDLVEMTLNRIVDGENVFFLHFELKDEQHAKHMFEEMVEGIKKENNRKTIKVLLSCTSGLTTNYFASMLNEAVSTLHFDLTFTAVSVTDILSQGSQYDVILLAPQIAYEYDKISEAFHDRLVLKVPGHIFASYDTGAVIAMIHDELKKFNTTKEEKAVAKVMRNIENNACILAITMLADIDEAHYGYRLYDKGKIIESGYVLKTYSSFQDIMDIIDTQLAFYKNHYHVDAIAVSIPGFMRMHDTSKKKRRISYSEIAEKLEKHYGMKVYVTNNTNAVVLGYYASQNQYDIITYHSQPRGSIMAGQGIIYEGKLITGSHKMSGEVDYIAYMEYSDIPDEINVYETHGKQGLDYIKDIEVRYLVANISIIDPQVILVRNAFTPDMNEIKQRIRQYVPENNMPELIYVRDVSEYSFLGTMMIGLEGLKGYYS